MSVLKAYPQSDSSPVDAKVITGTEVSSKVGLDVAIIDGTVSVSGPIAVTQSGAWTVTANAGTGTFTVGGTVSATQSGSWTVTANIGTISLESEYQDDTAYNQQVDIGQFILAVRQDSDAPLGSDGNYTPLQVDSDGFLKVASNQSGSWAVNINNSTGSSAVNIQDGGNSITVDGTVAATQSGTWNINDRPATASSTSISNITTTASSVGSVSNQIALAIFPIADGRVYFNVGGTATTSNAFITRSSPLILNRYTGSVSLIRASGSGNVQVVALTRS